MQTTLLQKKPNEIMVEIPEEIKEFVYFWNCYAQWAKLSKDPVKNSEALKNFESLHGTGFIRTIKFFSNQTGGQYA